MHLSKYPEHPSGAQHPTNSLQREVVVRCAKLKSQSPRGLPARPLLSGQNTRGGCALVWRWVGGLAPNCGILGHQPPPPPGGGGFELDALCSRLVSHCVQKTLSLFSCTMPLTHMCSCGMEISNGILPLNYSQSGLLNQVLVCDCGWSPPPPPTGWVGWWLSPGRGPK